MIIVLPILSIAWISASIAAPTPASSQVEASLSPTATFSTVYSPSSAGVVEDGLPPVDAVFSAMAHNTTLPAFASPSPTLPPIGTAIVLPDPVSTTIALQSDWDGDKRDMRNFVILLVLQSVGVAIQALLLVVLGGLLWRLWLSKGKMEPGQDAKTETENERRDSKDSKRSWWLKGGGCSEGDENGVVGGDVGEKVADVKVTADDTTIRESVDETVVLRPEDVASSINSVTALTATSNAITITTAVSSGSLSSSSPSATTVNDTARDSYSNPSSNDPSAPLPPPPPNVFERTHSRQGGLRSYLSAPLLRSPPRLPPSSSIPNPHPGTLAAPAARTPALMPASEFLASLDLNRTSTASTTSSFSTAETHPEWIVHPHPTPQDQGQTKVLRVLETKSVGDAAATAAGWKTKRESDESTRSEWDIAKWYKRRTGSNVNDLRAGGDEKGRVVGLGIV